MTLGKVEISLTNRFTVLYSKTSIRSKKPASNEASPTNVAKQNSWHGQNQIQRSGRRWDKGRESSHRFLASASRATASSRLPCPCPRVTRRREVASASPTPPSSSP